MSLRLVPVADGSSSADLLDGLNEPQRQAASHTEGPLLIIAGAGSGKTRVITYRIANMLRKGVHPSHILALTFTNKAAKEMRERISHLVGEQVARGIMAGTFHSVFARLLRRHAELLGYTSSFTVYDSDDQLAAIKAVMTTLGISQQVQSPTSIRSRISAAKNAMTSWMEYARNATGTTDRIAAQVFEQYEKRLLHANAMDFDDLILNMIALLRNNPDVLAQFHDRFRYIHVDEYQDTNRAQYIAVNLLAKGHRNLCVVGDDAQSIYRWRGAEIQNILDFSRDYSDVTTVRLEQNYRSTKTIIKAAESVIKNNKKQLPKELWTENADGDKITMLSCRDDRDEADQVVRTLKSRLNEHGLTWRDVAILYRTNAQSQPLEDALRRSNTPYHIVSGVSFYKRKEVKDALAYLRVLVNPSDAESILRIVNEPARGIGNTSLERLQAYATANGLTLYEVLKNPGNVPGLQTRTMSSVASFVNIFELYRETVNELAPASLAQAFLEATGLLDYYRSQKTDEARERLANIDRILTHISEVQEAEDDLTLLHYLEQVALISDQDDPELGNNRVALMTVHASKGLEFPLVVIAGMEQGLFPLVKPESSSDEEDEERRLFYVAITRARQHLVISYAGQRMRFGEVGFSRPSKFLSEIDSECLSASAKVHASSGRTVSLPPPRPRRPEPPRESYSQIPVEADHRWSVGMRVKHPMFGVGRIIALSGIGSSAKAQVEFSNGQRKQLMLAFARLEAL
jgi:DNA helicase-2/ATP-dependent DNA helicase PcrA